MSENTDEIRATKLAKVLFPVVRTFRSGFHQEFIEPLPEKFGAQDILEPLLTLMGNFIVNETREICEHLGIPTADILYMMSEALVKIAQEMTSGETRH